MILDFDGNVIEDAEESYTVKTLQNELDSLVTGLDLLIKHRDETVAKLYALCKENAKLKVKLQDALDARADYLEKANELNTKWGSVPWDALYDPSEAHNRYEIEQWYDANAPEAAK